MKNLKIFFILILFSCEPNFTDDNRRVYNVPNERKFIFKAGDTLQYLHNTKDSDLIKVNFVGFLYTDDGSELRQIQEIDLQFSDSLYSFTIATTWAHLSWGGLSTNFGWENPIKMEIMKKSFRDIYVLTYNNKPVDSLANIEIPAGKFPEDSKIIYFSPRYGPVRIIYFSGDTAELANIIQH